MQNRLPLQDGAEPRQLKSRYTENVIALVSQKSSHGLPTATLSSRRPRVPDPRTLVTVKRLFNVVFVERDEIRRIISLRKANLREVKRYAQT